MVRTGGPSRGCGVCRRRRIKCDEKSPSCSYCIKTKQKCPGYKDPFDLTWRDQTSVAQRNVERRKRASLIRQSKTEISTTPELDFKTSTSLNKISTFATVPPAIVENPEGYVIGFFFTNYATQPASTDERRGGFLEHVAPQYMNICPDSPLKMATLAIATFLFIAWLNRRPDNPISRSFYLKALSTMKNRILQPEGCADNDVLTSVLLMQMYETLNGMVKKSQHPRAHLDGALALIKHRGAQNFKDEIAQSVLFQIRSQLIEEAFRDGQPLSEDVTTWTAHLTPAEFPPATQLDNINVDLANLEALAIQRAALPQLIQSRFDSQEILLKAQDISRRLIEWSTTLPLSWLPIKISGKACIPASIKTAGLYENHCLIYPSVSVTSIWNKYRMSLIKNHSIIRSQVSRQASSSENLRLRIVSQNTIQQMADDICSSIPFLLGDKTEPGSLGDRKVQYPRAPGKEVPSEHYQMAPALGGFWLIGPLKTLIGSGIELREGQKEWVLGQLRRLRHIYNIGRR